MMSSFVVLITSSMLVMKSRLKVSHVGSIYSLKLTIYNH